MITEKEFQMKLLEKLAPQYKQAKSKKLKSQILSQFCELTQLSREAAKKRFQRYFKRRSTYFSPKKGRPPKYHILHQKIVKICWEILLCPCAERLHPVLSSTIDILLKEGLLKHYSTNVINETKTISLGTLKRILGKFEKSSFKKKYKGQAFIYHQIPISADFGKYAQVGPGYFEVDFVEHNGGNSSGRYAITGIYTDLYSQWTVRACGWGKNLESMKLIYQIVHQRIPFPVKCYHPDNDKSILRVLFEKALSDDKIKVFRSRPYKKNDNAHVEQKGGDKVRRLVGYFRYDTEDEVELLNQIYEVADLLENFFVPSMKVKHKVIDERGRVIKKVYDQAKTPYQRIMESSAVPEEVKEALKEHYNRLSLVELKKKLDELLIRLFGGKMKGKIFQGQKNDLTNQHFRDIYF